MFETIDPVSTQLSSEQVDNEPFGMVGPNTVQAVKRGVAAAGRTAASPFGALVTVTVADEYIRVLTARGNRVRAWAESELPAGVVQLGLIVDEQTFIEVLGGVLKQVTRNGKLNGQNLAEAILNASSDSMSIRPDEMQIEWDAEEFDLVDEEDEEALEFEGAENSGEEQVEPVDPGTEVAVRVETEQALVVSDETGLENLELDLEPEPDGDPYDVYALALHKHVIRRNLRTVSEFSGRFAGVQPKILALAAAVNSRAGVALDIESNTMITSVVSNGLPEVIREVGIDRDMTHEQWVNLIRTQISRAVAFYDSLFPEDPLGSDV
jgi:hypothetical protein